MKTNVVRLLILGPVLIFAFSCGGGTFSGTDKKGAKIVNRPPDLEKLTAIKILDRTGAGLENPYRAMTLALWAKVGIDTKKFNPEFNCESVIPSGHNQTRKFECNDEKKGTKLEGEIAFDLTNSPVVTADGLLNRTQKGPNGAVASFQEKIYLQFKVDSASDSIRFYSQLVAISQSTDPKSSVLIAVPSSDANPSLFDIKNQQWKFQELRAKRVSVEKELDKLEWKELIGATVQDELTLNSPDKGKLAWNSTCEVVEGQLDYQFAAQIGSKDLRKGSVDFSAKTGLTHKPADGKPQAPGKPLSSKCSASPAGERQASTRDNLDASSFDRDLSINTVEEPHDALNTDSSDSPASPVGVH